MERGWHNSQIFGDAPFSERDAWSWVVGTAQWKNTVIRSTKGINVTVRRGQLFSSVRFMADKFKWSKDRVVRFLRRFTLWGNISVETVSGQNLITVCNYEYYQSDKDDVEHTVEHTHKDAKRDRLQDKDKESTKEGIKESKKKKKERGDDLFPIPVGVKPDDFFLPDWIDPIDWTDFVEMRKTIKQPMTPRAAKLIINKLEKMKGQGHDISQILEKSITNNWRDVYEPKADHQSGGRAHHHEKPSNWDKTQAAFKIAQASLDADKLLDTGGAGEAHQWERLAIGGKSTGGAQDPHGARQGVSRQGHPDFDEEGDYRKQPDLID